MPKRRSTMQTFYARKLKDWLPPAYAGSGALSSCPCQECKDLRANALKEGAASVKQPRVNPSQI